MTTATIKSTSRLKPIALGLFAAALNAHAGTNGFIAPSFRGSADSEWGYWENFSVPFGAPGNTADRPGSTTGAVLTQNDTNAFLTGTFNIYNLSTNSVSSFSLTDATPVELGTVLLQTRSIGGELNYGSVTLSYTDGTGPHSLSALVAGESDRTSIPGLGCGVSRFWQWDLTGLGIDTYTLTFEAAGSSLSFDSLTLDTWNSFAAVPEPSTFAFAGAGFAALVAAMRLRRKKEHGTES